MHKAIEQSKLKAVAWKPDGSKSEGYMFGYVQGYYAGLNDALGIIRDYLSADEEADKFK
jgi:hypothetical protein